MSICTAISRARTEYALYSNITVPMGALRGVRVGCRPNPPHPPPIENSLSATFFYGGLLPCFSHCGGWPFSPCGGLFCPYGGGLFWLAAPPPYENFCGRP